MKLTCASCGLIFPSVSSFDKHRTGSYGQPIYGGKKGNAFVGYTPHQRRCLTIEEMKAKGMAQTAKGWWSTGEMFNFRKEGEAEDEPEEEEPQGA